MYMLDFEAILQLYLVNLFNYIFAVLYFSIFNHTSCGKHNVSIYVA